MLLGVSLGQVQWICVSDARLKGSECREVFVRWFCIEIRHCLMEKIFPMDIWERGKFIQVCGIVSPKSVGILIMNGRCNMRDKFALKKTLHVLALPCKIYFICSAPSTNIY